MVIPSRTLTFFDFFCCCLIRTVLVNAFTTVIYLKKFVKQYYINLAFYIRRASFMIFLRYVVVSNSNICILEKFSLEFLSFSSWAKYSKHVITQTNTQFNATFKTIVVQFTLKKNSSRFFTIQSNILAH